MNASFARMMSATWRFSSPPLLIKCMSNSPNIRERTLVEFNKASSLSSITSPLGKVQRTVARLSIVVISLALLAACSGGNREIQYDGTGSDEMRRSPCACMRIPYDPPAYRWGLG